MKDFGAFLEILPGVEGMCHISELAEGYVDKRHGRSSSARAMSWRSSMINVDDRGKIKLSHKAILVGAGADGDRD